MYFYKNQFKPEYFKNQMQDKNLYEKKEKKNQSASTVYLF